MQTCKKEEVLFLKKRPTFPIPFFKKVSGILCKKSVKNLHELTNIRFNEAFKSFFWRWKKKFFKFRFTSFFCSSDTPIVKNICRVYFTLFWEKVEGLDVGFLRFEFFCKTQNLHFLFFDEKHVFLFWFWPVLACILTANWL